MLDATDKPVLYTFRRCPYAMRARMGIYASGIEMEWRELVLRDKPDHMVQISPKATVPVVQLSDGRVIDESLDVMNWALGENDPHGWLPKSRRDHEQLKMIVLECDWTFKYHLDRYKYPNRYENAPPIGHRDAAVETLKKWNGYLETHANLLSDQAGFADYATFPFVRQFANVDRGWFDALPLRRLQDWLDRHLASEIFTNIMIKQKPWQPGDDRIVFPHVESAGD